MKNLTIAVPDDVYRTARIRAAERGTSISGLVADYLKTLSAGTEFARLEAQQKSIQAAITEFRASSRLTREQLHDRALR